MLKKIYQKLKSQGIRNVLDAAVRRIVPRRAASFEGFRAHFTQGAGLELGGPSGIFMPYGLFPVYSCATRIDNYNFGHQTIWEGAIKEGETFEFGKNGHRGNQFVSDATDLNRIASNTYDFVLSSHTLEHIANPLRALAEWTRVLKDGGLLALVLPHRDGTFDHRRPVTQLEHLVEDFEKQVDEGDLTHLDEILRLHDLGRDPAAGDFETFKARSAKNLENRSLHHHVFDTRLAIDLVDHIGLQITAVEAFRPYDILIVARKLTQGEKAQNNPFKGSGAEPLWTSPFPSDQISRRESLESSA